MPTVRVGLLLIWACAGCVTPESRLKKLIAEVTESEAKSKGPAALHNLPQPDELRAPPKPTCGAEVKTYNNQVCCTGVQEVWKPSTVAEVKEIVQREVRDKGRPLRVVGKMHSANEQLCTDGVVISTENLNTFKKIERMRGGQETVLVDAGVTLRDLNRWLYDENRSLGYTVLGFRGITVAGAIATAAHGSSMKHPSVISSLVESVRLVGADGDYHEYWKDKTDPDTFRALAANLGMLGVVVRVRLRVQPKFDLGVQVRFDTEGALWKKGVEGLVGACDYGQVVWFPRADRIMTMCGTRSDEEPQPGAQNVLLQPKATPTELSLFRQIMESTIRTGAPLCTIETERYRALKRNPPLQRDCGCKRKNACGAVGASHLMMSSDLTPAQLEIPEVDFEVAVPMAQARQALEVVNDFANRKLICLPLIGVFLRFSPREDSTLIGHSVSDEGAFKDGGVMFLEFVAYVPKDKPPTAAEPYYLPYRELARRLLDAPFYGRAHWGKNEADLFVVQRERNPLYKARLEKFRAIAKQLDPTGAFTNAFSKRVGLSD